MMTEKEELTGESADFGIPLLKKHWKAIVILTVITLSLTGCFTNKPPTAPENITESGLVKDIEDGKSIMWIGPHPDDEMFMSGTFALACGDRGNKCYVLCVVSVDNINPDLNITARKEAIAWFTKTYLTERFDLNFSRPPAFNLDDVKKQIFNKVEAIKPDIIITFSPYGYFDQQDHIATSKIVTEVYKQLSYKPKIYYIINMDQDIVVKSQYEYRQYPPTDIIDLNVYSNKLGKTFWEAKVEFLEHYAQSIPDLQKLLNSRERMQKNDRKEYFMRVSP